MERVDGVYHPLICVLDAVAQTARTRVVATIIHRIHHSPAWNALWNGHVRGKPDWHCVWFVVHPRFLFPAIQGLWTRWYARREPVTIMELLRPDRPRPGGIELVSACMNAMIFVVMSYFSHEFFRNPQTPVFRRITAHQCGCTLDKSVEIPAINFVNF